MGHTNATKHKIVLKDPDTPLFKEHFCRIPPPQLDEVREHLKLMLDAGVIWPSNSPWCNAALVFFSPKYGSFFFFFFIFEKILQESFLQLAHTRVCTKLKENTWNSQCTILPI